MDNWINLLPVLVLGITCYLILRAHQWQRIILYYALIFLSAFSITAQYWSFTFSLVKVLTGLMSLVILGISMNRHHEPGLQIGRAESIFRMAGLSLLNVIVIFIVSRVSNYLAIPVEIGLASLLMIAFGLFQLGITHEPHRIFLAIIMFFYGFELIYSANETSLLVNGLLAFITLLVALIGSYLIINQFEGGAE